MRHCKPILIKTTVNNPPKSYSLYFIGWIDIPVDIFLMAKAWLLMSWFGLSLGLIVGVLSEKLDWFAQLWRTVMILVLPFSGALVFVERLPQKMRDAILWIPMVHGTEMFRHGYFGDYIHTHENAWYLILCNFIMLFLGLVLVQQYSRGVEPS